MKKFLNTVKEIVSVVLILGVVFGAGYYFGDIANQQENVAVEEKDGGMDLELPLEVERRTVTVDEVESRLVEIGELSTISGEYTYTLGKDETRYWLDKIPVFGSTNSITITCKGNVKVGYNMQDIVAKVDDEIIYISIPEAQINDNYVIWDSVECKESNCIFNPIEFTQYQELIDEIEEKGLKDVTDKGIYQRAEDNLKVLIEAFLSEFDDYKIVYM